MRGGIFYGKAFGNRGGVQITIGRNYCDRPATRLLMNLADFKSNRQLHSVVGSEPVLTVPTAWRC